MFRTLDVVRCRNHRIATTLIVAIAACGCAQAASKSQSQPASKPPSARVEKPAAPTDKTPKSLVATAPDGTKIAYEVTGTGPALMMLHGGGQSRRSWSERGYVDRLSKRFTVITMDLRGNGDSDKPMKPDAYALDVILADPLAVADAAGVKRFHVWGFGHGAVVARYLAARSDRVLSAILVSANMGPAVTGLLKEGITAMRAKWQPLVEAQVAGTLDLKTLSPGEQAAWNSSTALSAIALGALLDYPPLEPADLKAPTLWLVGSEDSGAMENVKQYEGKLTGTNVTLKVLSSMSYSDTFMKVEQVMAEIDAFLGRVGGSSSVKKKRHGEDPFSVPRDEWKPGLQSRRTH